MIRNSETSGCLKGIRVIDLTRVLAGPYCTMILADMGAEVIKVERTGLGDDSREYPPFENNRSSYFGDLNRNKKSIDLNLKKDCDKSILTKLIASADVVVENFKPGTMDKLGFSYEKIKEINPRVVFASISGFGQYGEYKERPGYDIIGQAMSGFMSVTGWAESSPTRTGTAIGDILGGLNACIGILGALMARERTNAGERVDVSLVDSCVSAMNTLIQILLIEKRVPRPIGNRYEFIYPYDTFEALDGWIVIAVGNDSVWKRFCSTMKREDLLKDSSYNSNSNRVKNHIILNEEITKMTKAWPKAKLVSLLLDNSIPSCEILDLGEVINDPHIIRDRKMLIEARNSYGETMKVVGSPIKFTENIVGDFTMAPELGEHREEILKQIFDNETLLRG